jgi:hypothetical protein
MLRIFFAQHLVVALGNLPHLKSREITTNSVGVIQAIVHNGTRRTVTLNLGRMWTKAPAQHVAFLHVLNNEQNTSLDVYCEHSPEPMGSLTLRRHLLAVRSIPNTALN